MFTYNRDTRMEKICFSSARQTFPWVALVFVGLVCLSPSPALAKNDKQVANSRTGIPTYLEEVLDKTPAKLFWIGNSEFNHSSVSQHRDGLIKPRPVLEYDELSPATAKILEKLPFSIGLSVETPCENLFQLASLNPSIFYLHLRFSKIPDWVPNLVSKLQNLTALRISVDDTQNCPMNLLASLSTLENLEHLSLVNVNIGGQARVDPFFGMKLRSLELRSCDGLSVVLNKKLKELSDLAELRVVSSVFSIESARAVSACSSITTLSFRDSTLISGALSTLVPLKKVIALDLEGAKCDYDELKSIVDFRRLEFLSLRKTVVDDEFVKSLSVLRIRSLWLSGTSVTNRAALSLSQMRNLDHIDLASTPINDDGVNMLLTFLSVGKLCLSNTSISDKCVEVLIASRIADLDVSYTKLSYQALFKLSSCEELLHLTLSEGELDHTGPSALQKARPTVKLSILK